MTEARGHAPASASEPVGGRLAVVSLAALGVVYGDIGTSPLYAIRECFHGDGLDHLLNYYLPLLEARERAYNAYRHFYIGKTEQTVGELDKVEAILMTVANADHGHLLREMKEPLEELEDARAALDADTGEAAEALQALASRLNLLLLKGGLVLAD